MLKNLLVAIAPACYGVPEIQHVFSHELHLEHAEIHTVNKDLDALTNKDLSNNKTNTHIHLFSNILDIDKFSLSHLLKLVESNFPGDNYFICVSPYINDTRTSRIDAFVNYFSKKANFKRIQSIDNRSGEWQGTWIRVVRVFNVSI